MVRLALAPRRYEAYLQKCGEEHKVSYGLIIGQPGDQDCDYIVHLARNSEQDVDGGDVDIPERVEDEADAVTHQTHSISSVGEIDGQSLIHQVISVTKMLPGCFYVLGMFVVAEQNVFADERSVADAKLLLQQVHNILKQNKNFCGVPVIREKEEQLLLSYSTLTKTTVCKTFEFKEGGGYFMPVEWQFTNKAMEWHNIESNFELDDVFPIIERDEKVNIEDHFHKSLEAVSGYVQNSEIFFQNEDLVGSHLVEFVRRLKPNPKEAIKASIFLPAIVSPTDQIRVEKFNGCIKFAGIISSRVWSYPKSTIREVKTFIRHDIVRSLAARIQIYCDGLTEPNVSQDSVVISEPPRRIFFDLPEGNGVQFSEYIFRGETPTVAAAQAKEMLDLDIDTDHIHSDVEGLLDDDAFSLSAQHDNATPSTVQQEISRTMYIVGLVVALLVLFVSILLHFMLR